MTSTARHGQKTTRCLTPHILQSCTLTIHWLNSKWRWKKNNKHVEVNPSTHIYTHTCTHVQTFSVSYALMQTLTHCEDAEWKWQKMGTHPRILHYKYSHSDWGPVQCSGELWVCVRVLRASASLIIISKVPISTEWLETAPGLEILQKLYGPF